MKEYLTEAFVLGVEDVGEFDKSVFLYTKDLGRVTARAKGARKIISKLTGHLQPLNFVRVRLVEKNGFQVADALSFKKIEASPESLELADFVREMTFEFQPDRDLWSVIRKGAKISNKNLLKVFGFDPLFAECVNCGSKKPEFFSKTEHVFLCKKCALSRRLPNAVKPKLPRDLILVE